MVGCGGGGSDNSSSDNSSPTRVHAQVVIDWPARSRSRALIGLTSSLSARVTFRADPGGGENDADETYLVNRNTSPSAYSGTYPSPQPVKVGEGRLDMVFYALPDGGGDITGTLQKDVVVSSDGSLNTVVSAATVATTP